MSEVDEELAAELFVLSQLCEEFLTVREVWELEGLVDGAEYRGAYDFLQQRLAGRSDALGPQAVHLMRDVAERLAAAGR